MQYTFRTRQPYVLSFLPPWRFYFLSPQTSTVIIKLLLDLIESCCHSCHFLQELRYKNRLVLFDRKCSIPHRTYHCLDDSVASNVVIVTIHRPAVAV